MRTILLNYWLVAPRETLDRRDGFAWLMLVLEGKTGKEALEALAHEAGDGIGAVRKRVERFFERGGIEPPVQIPRLR